MKRLPSWVVFQYRAARKGSLNFLTLSRITSTLGALALATFLAVGVSPLAAAQAAPGYPNKAIRVVVAFAPGSGLDVSIRTIAPKLSEVLGQQIIVDNRVGASGIVGTEIVAKAAPDGYTLLFATTDLAINSALFATLPYDPLKDFAPIGRAVNFLYFLVVNTDFPAQNVQELLALAKTWPGGLSYASAGNGTPPHIGAEMFKQLTKVDLVHIPYKGSAQALTDLISGRVQLMIVNTASAMPHVRAGRLRVLGISTAQRVAIAPEVPTIAEAGVPGYELIAWTGIVAPSATPRDIIVRLNRELVRVLALAEIKEKLMGQGSEVTPSTPEQFSRLIAADTERLGRVAKTAKMRLD
jgi:tripartite-type tricarboxylate transporter receptor subunit TctC